jgi:hypothetical protein
MMVQVYDAELVSKVLSGASCSQAVKMGIMELEVLHAEASDVLVNVRGLYAASERCAVRNESTSGGQYPSLELKQNECFSARLSGKLPPITTRLFHQYPSQQLETIEPRNA